jgi:hypothetical protein
MYGAITAHDTFAQGNLIVLPRRVVFEGVQKTQELKLANIGTDTAKYLISVIQYRMNQDGTFESITEPDSNQNFADKHFRFFPRSVVLAPNESQTVKVQLVNTGELTPGESRSHLYFRAVSNEKPLDGSSDKKEETAISVHLVPVFGVAIPVIIRSGPTTSNVSLSNSSFKINSANIPQLNLYFCRSGNKSVYGDLTVNHISPQGKITLVGLAKGFAVYTPNMNRTLTFILDEAQNVNYRQGKLHIVYSTPLDAIFEKIAETELILF